MNKEKVDHFRTIAACDEETATRYLEFANHDVERAIQLFFDGVVPVSPAHGNNSLPSTSDVEVRAPINPISERIVDVDVTPRFTPARSTFGHWFSATSSTATTNSFFTRSRKVEHNLPTGNDDNDVQIVGETPSRTSRAVNPRGSLFEPPQNFLFPGGLEQAAQTAERLGQWLLVSLHFDNVFDCHRVNRDVWNNDTVQSVVRSNFVIWQGDTRDYETRRFMQFHQDAYEPEQPNLIICHPLTSAVVAQSSRLFHPEDVIVFLSGFIDSHNVPTSTLPPPHAIPNIVPTAPSQPSSSSSSTRRRKRHHGGPNSPIVVDDEEEASASPELVTPIGQQPAVKRARTVDMQSNESPAPPSSTVVREQPTNGVKESSSTAATPSKVDLRNGATTSDDELRLLVRLPNGAKTICFVSPNQPIQVLIQHFVERGYPTSEFELVQDYPRRSFLTLDPHTTFVSLGLCKMDTLYLQEI